MQSLQTDGFGFLLQEPRRQGRSVSSGLLKSSLAACIRLMRIQWQGGGLGTSLVVQW